ncbi:MAG: EI24 domain-containing protein [Alphaproteobacteria bacterium]
MLRHLSKAVRQLDDPALQKVVAGSLALAVAALVLLWAVLWWLGGLLGGSEIGWIVWLRETLGGLFDWLGGALLLGGLAVLTLLLFPAVVTMVAGLFLEQVAAAVERRHYPDAPPPRPQPVGEAVGSAARFALVAIGANLMALPLYIAFLFLPPLNLLLFYLLNGYLAGREYFELVAYRRMPPEAADRLRRTERRRILLAGMLTVLVMTIPILNLLSPVIATAFMLHVFQALPRRNDFARDSGAGS